MDDLVKEYLLSRGFTATARQLEIDLKNDKDKSFRVSLTHCFSTGNRTWNFNGEIFVIFKLSQIKSSINSLRWSLRTILVDWEICGITMTYHYLKGWSTISCLVPDPSILILLISWYLPSMVAIKKMENSILRMYLINAAINTRQEKVHEFFEKLGPDLQNQTEWKDWFCKW